MMNTMILVSRSFHDFPVTLDQNGWWVKIETEELLNSLLHSNHRYFTYQIYFGRALNTNKSNNKMNRNTEFLKVLEAVQCVTNLRKTSTIDLNNN